MNRHEHNSLVLAELNLNRGQPVGMGGWNEEHSILDSSNYWRTINTGLLILNRRLRIHRSVQPRGGGSGWDAALLPLACVRDDVLCRQASK